VVTRAGLVHELAEMARAEQQAIESQEDQEVLGRRWEAPSWSASTETGPSRRKISKRLLAYEKQFHKPMPISAQGETALHPVVGFDHATAST
jgi:hypothetical protein